MLTDASVGVDMVEATPDERTTVVDFFEHRNLPFLIAVNEFESAPKYPVAEVRKALTLPERAGRQHRRPGRRSATDALIAVSEYALATLSPTGR